MLQQSLRASSSTAGFFQTLPALPPQYTSPDSLSARGEPESPPQNATEASDDKVLCRILDLYLPKDAKAVTQHAHRIARLSLDPDVLANATDAETNHPVLRPLTTFGEENRNDPLWTTAGWRKLKDIGYEEGIVAVAYDKSNTAFNRRIHQFANVYLWGPTGTMTGCPQSMTDGAAVLMSRHLRDPDGDQPGRSQVFEEVYRRLTSRNHKEAWTSGQWMTERTGGSDVSGTETVANRLTPEEIEREISEGRQSDAVGMPLGNWKIDGFKWFSSATDSEMSVLLARTAKGGLSAFYIPMRRRVKRKSLLHDAALPTELNGIRIQRLKNKLGTKSLPTAELELKGARGWLVGTEGQGVKEISAILNITRLHTAVTSAASWARGLAICRAYSKVRKVRGGLLADNPAHLRWMADETVKYWAGTHFAFLGVALQGALDQGWENAVQNTRASKLIPQDKAQTADLLRLVLPAMKAQISVASVHGLRNCMECLGGVGYCENNEDGGLMNIAKIYRDQLVNPIWEGTVSVMAEDCVRVILDKRLGNGDVMANVFAPWIRGVIGAMGAESNVEVDAIEQRLKDLLGLVQGASKEELLYHGRDILDSVEFITSSLVLLYDARTSPDTAVLEVVRRYIRSNSNKATTCSSRDALAKTMIEDKAIFLGSMSAHQGVSAKL
ncbi:uncharacterized protein CC84DRAFT_48668 [Paraphaeosphaeria sporulosa]|uniref:Acyl-CoA dehydrogenase/oxidase C-terminal n=1 Tax=Paraphaeosphaeria sporulosa TaxID=1460663 RepID=A0A177CXY1_9PLEO|nr:uncharacterized protein CC84DRAFT_48668 [Paraphaeosphaeria sporulosa]OAG11752.1 hypothetical protein CC84DRAFT_48668 [Paraphaeosphaeria sporulosa]